MYKLQNLYLLVLNPIGRITQKIDERIRNAIITLCGLFFSVFFIAYYDKYERLGLYLNHAHNNAVCWCVLAILIIFSIKTPLKKIKWDPMLFLSFFSAGAGIVFISFFHSVGNGYASHGLAMMFGFPCLYFVWNNRKDYDTLYKRLSGAMSATGLLLYIYCIWLATTGALNSTNGLVCAFFFNSNLFSMVGMAMVCSAVYMFYAYWGNLLPFLYTALTFSTGWSVILLGGSRLSVLIGIGAVFSLLVYSVKTKKTRITDSSQLSSYAKVLVVVALMVALTSFGFRLSKINEAVLIERSTDNATELSKGVQNTDYEEKNPTIEKFTMEGQDLNTYTSGRIVLWEKYSAHLNMIGNDISKTNFTTLTGSYVVHAHNNFLEYAYRCGVPVACIHIYLELYSGVICLMLLFNKKYREPYYLFAIVFMFCYAIESLFDIATLPFERHAPFFFYMSLMPVFGKASADKRRNVLESLCGKKTHKNQNMTG